MEDILRPKADYSCWYDSAPEEQGGPGLLLLGRKTGLLVMVVAAWSPEEVISATPREWLLKQEGGRVRRPNPARWGRERAEALAERVGRLKDVSSVPVGYMAVFPRFHREAFEKSGLHWFLPAECAFFRDDLDPNGPLASDPSGKRFRERICRALPFRCKALGRREEARIRHLVHPEVRIPARGGVKSGQDAFRRGVEALDEMQARVALRLDRGHQIITGPAGSGKTLVLAHRCVFLCRYAPLVRRILFVCYNIALVGHLERLLRDRGVEPAESGVRVTHFYELCGLVLEERVGYENRTDAYYRDVTARTLMSVSDGRSALTLYDAVLVDEGQDFGDDMLRIVSGLLKPKGDLLIATDASQNLYGRRAAWKSLGIKAKGRTRRLEKVYRNTSEIFHCSRHLIGRPSPPMRQPALLPAPWPFHGPLPRLARFSTQEEVDDFLVEEIQGRVAKRGYEESDIAILYDDKIYGPGRFSYDNRTLPMRVLGRLEAAGIRAYWVSRDAASKRAFEEDRNRVTLISIHSSKGLDFHEVFLLGVDRLNPEETVDRRLITLLYVAMTRARYQLNVPYTDENDRIRRVISCVEAEEQRGTEVD